MNGHWHYERDPEDIGWLRLDYAEGGTNVLSNEVLEELGKRLDAIEAAPPGGLVLASAKPKGFIAGADVNEFLEIGRPEQAEAHIRRVHRLFERLEALPCPSVALIHGFCLGGGLELALACRYRIATDDPSTRLGFPEVRLGLFPGYGGTVRAVRRLGPLAALPLMLSGRAVSAREAGRLGLVDWVVPERQLRDAGPRLLRRPPRPRPVPWWSRLAGTAPLRPLVADRMRREADRHADPAHYPAPRALLEHWQRFGGDQADLFESEARSVAALLCSDTARNLIRVFRLQERLKGLGRGGGFEPRRVHVVGGGVMGGDIAAWCALQGLTVTLQDTGPERLTGALARAHALFRKRLKEPRRIQAALDRLQPDPRGHGVSRADLVIEAIFEDAVAKRDLYQTLEPRMGAGVPLATNTSAIPLDELASALADPGRLIGLHFFNPVDRMQLVEVVRGPASDPEAVAKGLALVRRIDRLPLPVTSAPGFLVNRVLMPYLLEAVGLIEEGVPPAAVDRAARAFGMPVGPVELADGVGLDICLAVARELAGRIATPAEVPETLARLVAEGRLGRKSGRGFYVWQGEHARVPRIPSDYRAPEDIAERLVFRLLNEAVACLREGIVEDADLLDAGVVFGTGFAPFRGGPLHYAASGGPGRMRRRLGDLYRDHGEHFHPDSGWASI